LARRYLDLSLIKKKKDWWDHYAYFGPREPIALNVNYFFHYDKYKPNELSQTKRAAYIIRATLEFKKKLENEELEPEMLTPTIPLDMSAYEWMFSTCRIPSFEKDFLKKYDTKESKHIVVARKNKFYWFNVILEDGSISSSDNIEKQLNLIIDMANNDNKIEPPLGILTADHRDYWTKVRNTFVQFHKQNNESLKILESSIFMICLDDTNPSNNDDIARELWHGNGRNRWFDKSLQFIIFENGVCGVNGEHSKLDGMPVARLSNFILYEYKENENFKTNKYLQKPSNLVFSWSSEVIHDIEKSCNNFFNFVNGFEMKVLQFTNFGKSKIKEFNLSPDAFVQMAFQLTYYKIYGKICAQYESAQTKKYYHGRTEVLRVLSIDSYNWVKSMLDKNVEISKKILFLEKACKSHTEYGKDAINGYGVDRLLLGLRLIGKENNIEEHPIFNDIAYIRSTHWTLSTSQMSSDGFHVGFGPVVDDGFGICYCIRNHMMFFTISSHSNPQYISTKFKEVLKKSLEEMKILCETKIKSLL
jgi:carnitine O-acetyltransferase